MASELKLTKAQRIFPTFHFFKELRRGAHKSTFHVRQEDEDGNDENLCLKVLNQDFFQKARFERETELLGNLPPHPNLAEFHSASTVNFKGAKFHYLCEHFIPGDDLDDLLNSSKAEPWPEQRAAKFFAELCDGLQVLHEHRRVHALNNNPSDRGRKSI